MRRLSLAVTPVAALIIAVSCALNEEQADPTRPPPSTKPIALSELFLPACPTSTRPQNELDFAGLPPWVPKGDPVKCLLVASHGGTAYDAGYSAAIELVDGRQLQLYQRRTGPPQKEGPSQTLRQGTRDVGGTSWSWAVLENGVTTLSATLGDTYVQLALGGDESRLDTLGAIAATLRPVESLPRPSAREICASLPISRTPFTVAAAFDSTAAAIARWEETPETPGGPRVSGSDWRRHRADEPVALCYLDGDFGPPRMPPPAPGAIASAMPNYDRVVYVVGVERRPRGRTFGWQDRIVIHDPGR